MEKYIVTVSREVEFTTAFEITATSLEQAKLLATKQAGKLSTDTTLWAATVHANTVSVFPKIKNDLS